MSRIYTIAPTFKRLAALRPSFAHRVRNWGIKAT